MSDAKEHSLHDNIQIDEEAAGLGNLALGVGAGALALGLVLAGGLTKQFQLSYLIAFMYVLSVGLGALWFVTLQHLTNAKWSVVVRRVAEILAANMPWVGLLSLVVIVPMAMGSSDLYVWIDTQKVHDDHLLHHKAPYLNFGFFALRCVVYFGFWALLSRYFLRQSLSQDSSGKGEVSASLQKLSAPAMILLAVTLTFCAIDFIMSLEPEWFSTIFGVYYFAGCVLSGYATLALSLMWLQRHGRLVHSVNREHYHDLGKMMFAFVVFWSYIAFSQFMLIWYGDIPEETVWYKARLTGDWKIVSAALLACHFAIPFFGLMSRHVKRNRKTLAFWALWLLAIHYVDLYWLVMPTFSPGVVAPSLVDLLCLVGLAGVFVGMAARRARGLNLIPTKDPRLADSLAFENV